MKDDAIDDDDARDDGEDDNDDDSSSSMKQEEKHWKLILFQLGLLILLVGRDQGWVSWRLSHYLPGWG